MKCFGILIFGLYCSDLSCDIRQEVNLTFDR